ncbi:rhodanese-related sulfurtransferase [Variovorax sp. NFACC27]|uniref:rhodanese-related sulfurtransferase n=1 Tax=unclassified Variovorax TaxID=663243 RepID=UPI000898C181|nr:Rhodanese-like domain-containing protein [Variovorax sp. NFACC28]SEG87862.1 Rhodanese-like domain-containing protein [Variovorax sp. NFACC29]SFD27197.1 Rhodanese-like domain-containing protein [Variovorax sp. NFACC26]SFG34686.1 Rhodanese-like domain-containing protein [Variovorax sp. NFACC27]
MTTTATSFPVLSFAAVRERLIARDETALLDVREEDPFAQEHPLWAANLPLSRIEIEAWRRIPRRDTLIVLYGEHGGTDLAPQAARTFAALGYTNVHLLEGGLEGWRKAGGELFRDVNVPSKSFGELVEHERHTPSLSAQEVKALVDAKADVVVLDARRFDEYQTMSIPSATSVPGAELVLRVRELAPDPATRVIVNCAGRTRSIIGTQSLVNAGIPNPVAALRNGTIGWKLAGQVLDHGASRQAPAAVSQAHRAQAQVDARRVADLAGVRRIALGALQTLETPGRTVYRFDVRTPEEYAAGHLPGFANAPGGQLVQETDHQVPVRGARIVLADDDGVRASMSASWLAQMGWEVYVPDVVPTAADLVETTAPTSAYPPVAATVGEIAPGELAALLKKQSGTAVIDVTTSANYVKRHIPGAWYAIRAQLAQALDTTVPASQRYVLTCGSSLLARYAAADLRALLDARGQGDAEVLVLAGGNAAWFAAGLEAESGETRLATARTDRYRRPYEGTDAPAEAMQAYLDWEFGLVEQLGRDGTHHFAVI